MFSHAITLGRSQSILFILSPPRQFHLIVPSLLSLGRAGQCSFWGCAELPIVSQKLVPFGWKMIHIKKYEEIKKNQWLWLQREIEVELYLVLDCMWHLKCSFSPSLSASPSIRRLFNCSNSEVIAWSLFCSSPLVFLAAPNSVQWEAFNCCSWKWNKANDGYFKTHTNNDVILYWSPTRNFPFILLRRLRVKSQLQKRSGTFEQVG